MIVYVVTNPELGWDCVQLVTHNLKTAVEYCGGEYVEGKNYYSYEFNDYVIHEKRLSD